MPAPKSVSVVTERGQVSIPAGLRKQLRLRKGQRLAWERTSERELRVVVLDDTPPRGARAMLGFARTFRSRRQRTGAWMREIRAGER